MKRMLSLLSTVSIIATSASVVASCSSANKEFNQFNKYLEESKNKTLIVYLGAKNNNSSLSFEDGLQEVTNSRSFSEAISKINNGSSQTQNSFISKFHNQLNWSVTKQNDENPTDNLYKVDVKKEKDKDSKETREYWIRTTKIGDNTQKLFENMTDEVRLESIIYDKIQNKWDDGVRKKILDDYLISNLAKQFYGLGKNPNNKERKNVTTYVSILTESVKSLEGPLFMVLRDGMFYGMISGFETFTKREEKDKAKCIDLNADLSVAKKVREDVFNNKFIDSLKNSILNYNIQNIYNSKANNDEVKKTIFAPSWHYADNERNDEKKK